MDLGPGDEKLGLGGWTWGYTWGYGVDLGCVGIIGAGGSWICSFGGNLRVDLGLGGGFGPRRVDLGMGGIWG